ncbi:MAG: glycosyltransferase family 4 protein, partial [Candidatus Margulisbacteria bacterium]|nr:glycosyltransferase family 4 protein [Candidatus Margulisiibacteriota bacterium]
MGIGVFNTIKLSKSRISVGFIGTYIPRKCGIATFTKDTVDSVLKANPLNMVEVAALTDKVAAYNYPEEVKIQIEQNNLDAYFNAADFFNKSEVSVISLQHEFGIFGGKDGEYILTLLKKLKKPVITTLHTVLANPTDHRKKVLQEIIKYSHGVVVLISHAVKILVDVYKIPAHKIFVIPHGVPEVHFFDSARIKKLLKLEGKTVFSTFGLISRQKGLEYAVSAIAKTVKEHPNILYLILGQTHPAVIDFEGESYRESLETQVKNLGIEKNVVFINKYLTIDELLRYLLATDIYVVPYLGKEQIASGTVAYAVGCGKAVVSTSFIYAEEVLSQNRGILIPFKDADALALSINRILSEPKLKQTLEENAYKYGRKMIWANIGKDYIRLFKRANLWMRWKNRIKFLEKLAFRRIKRTITEVPISSAEAVIKEVKRTQLLLSGYPQLTFEHLYRLTDDTSLLRFAVYSVPNKKAGYSLDDAARALIALVKKYRLRKNESALEFIRKYLSFIQYTYKEDGTFHNFMNYDRSWADEVGSEDCFGRAIWACGFTYFTDIDTEICITAKQLIEHIIDNF